MRIADRRLFLGLSVVLCGITLAGPAFADLSELTYGFSSDLLIPPGPTSPSYNTNGLYFPVPQFNPLLGQLQAVTISETISAWGTFTVEGGGLVGGMVVGGFQVGTSSAPFRSSCDSNLTDTPCAEATGSTGLDLFDGPAPVGPYLQSSGPWNYNESVLGGVNSIAPYIGNGNIYVGANADVEYQTEFHEGAVGALGIDSLLYTVNLNYDYTPSGPPTPEPTYFVVTGGLLGLLAFRALRRKLLA